VKRFLHTEASLTGKYAGEIMIYFDYNSKNMQKNELKSKSEKYQDDVFCGSGKFVILSCLEAKDVIC
jgi:hypothetical protein